MIYLIFAIIGMILAFNLGVIIAKKKYKQTIIDLQLAQKEQNNAWGRHCKALREQYQRSLMQKREKFALERTHENEPCIYEEKEKYRNVTVVIAECKKCGHIDIAWHRQDDTEEIEV